MILPPDVSHTLMLLGTKPATGAHSTTAALGLVAQYLLQCTVAHLSVCLPVQACATVHTFHVDNLGSLCA